MDKNENDNSIGEDDGAGLVIRLKLPKKAEEEKLPKRVVDEAPPMVAEELKSHYCKDCDKSFSSGKALGGHMSSAHVQANKDYSLKKTNSKRKSSASYSGSQDNKCMHCHRVFQSKKSLFGHMRCHPDRLWRGMEPPPECRAAEGSSDGDCEDSDLGFDLKDWPSSNKRGRGPGVMIHTDPPPGKEPEPFVLGSELIRMIGDKPEDRNSAGPTIELREGKGKEASSPSSDEIDPTGELFKNAVNVLASLAVDIIPPEVKEVTETAAQTGEQSDATSSSPEKYKCEQCNRFFPTHQALGGHRSSHNKFKLTIINTNNRASPPVKNKRAQSTKKEKGQYSKKDKAEATFGLASPSPSPAGSGTASVRDIDLNVVATAGEEEEEEESSEHTPFNASED